MAQAHVSDAEELIRTTEEPQTGRTTDCSGTGISTKILAATLVVIAIIRHARIPFCRDDVDTQDNGGHNNRRSYNTNGNRSYTRNTRSITSTIMTTI